MTKKPSKELLRQIKERDLAETRSNYTFRLRKLKMDLFKRKCEAAGVSMASVVEELIESFLDG
jgi:multidrug efflux pump subunit AcrB